MKQVEVAKPETAKVVWKQMTIRIPADVHRALKVRAAEEGRSVAEIVEALIRQYLVGTRP